MKRLQVMLYMSGFALFFLCLTYTVYFGFQTFHVETERTVSSDYDYHIALIPEELDNDYWKLIEQGARDAAEEHNIYIEYVGAKQADDDEQLRTLDKMIAAKVDGILIQGMGVERFYDLVHEARQKGIPIVTVDTDSPLSERFAYVGTNNYKAGYIAGEALVNNTTGHQYVGVITGRNVSKNQQLRVSGFQDAIASYDRIEIVDIRESNITKVGAAEATYELLKEHANINAFFGTSALDGIGIHEGITQMNVKNHPYIIAFDDLPETIRLVQRGKIQATVIQQPYEMGVNGVHVLMDLMKRKHTPELHFTNIEVIHREDVLNRTYKGGVIR
ncbi:sugar-binding protein [Salirhabdus salicampi]|uniref:sugar-binding protein n=1 Tax=Salirhabdus salicampi TaxID=476102 RepID=UPI0020C42B9C|nr:sugar-binding protein [Salirhabdus salicampi]MCP8617559.1 sugar-binding protein [Salirhabdus salicampi]